MKRLGLILIAFAGLAAVTAACDGSEPETATREPVEISAIDNTFRPERITVAVGTELVWTNDGRSDHDIIPADGGRSW